jgi:hypothetical protein
MNHSHHQKHLKKCSYKHLIGLNPIPGQNGCLLSVLTGWKGVDISRYSPGGMFLESLVANLWAELTARNTWRALATGRGCKIVEKSSVDVTVAKAQAHTTITRIPTARGISFASRSPCRPDNSLQ